MNVVLLVFTISFILVGIQCKRTKAKKGRHNSTVLSASIGRHNSTILSARSLTSHKQGRHNATQVSPRSIAPVEHGRHNSTVLSASIGRHNSTVLSARSLTSHKQVYFLITDKHTLPVGFRPTTIHDAEMYGIQLEDVLVKANVEHYVIRDKYVYVPGYGVPILISTTSSGCEHENGGCSHICHLTDDESHKCMCPENHFLANDGKMCQDICYLPPVRGDANNLKHPSWYYDSNSKSCKEFLYGGSGAKGNHFKSERECCNNCCSPMVPGLILPTQKTTPIKVKVAPMVPGLILPTQKTTPIKVKVATKTPSSTRKSFPTPIKYDCDSIPDIGECWEQKKLIVAWYYELSSGTCKPFGYGGCGGNGNRYETKEECWKWCVPLDPTKNRGKTPTNNPIIGSDTNEEEGRYTTSGSISTIHRKLTSTTVQPAIHDMTTTVTPLTTKRDDCESPPDTGILTTKMYMWYYDVSNKKCDIFAYGGIGGNGNRYITKEECMDACAPPPTPTPTPTPKSPTLAERLGDEGGKPTSTNKPSGVSTPGKNSMKKKKTGDTVYPKRGKEFRIKLTVLNEGNYVYDMTVRYSPVYQKIKQKLTNCVSQIYAGNKLYRDVNVIGIEFSNVGIILNFAIRFKKDVEGNLNLLINAIKSGRLCGLMVKPEFVLADKPPQPPPPHTVLLPVLNIHFNEPQCARGCKTDCAPTCAPVCCSPQHVQYCAPGCESLCAPTCPTECCTTQQCAPGCKTLCDETCPTACCVPSEWFNFKRNKLTEVLRKSIHHHNVSQVHN